MFFVTYLRKLRQRMRPLGSWRCARLKPADALAKVG
jgi:hypothetical protein